MADETLVHMPRLADTLVEGTLARWLKQVGEQVAQGEPLASIETDKITTDLPSPAAGTLLEHAVAEGETVPVETVIARIGAAHAQSAPKPTPVAARLLAEHGLTPELVPTRSGRLTKDEVVQFLEARSRPGEVSVPLSREGTTADKSLPLTTGGIPLRGRSESPPSALPAQRAVAPPAKPGLVVPLTAMRRAIADHMAHARQTIPHGQTVMDADLTHLVAWRDQHKAAFQQTEHANLSFTVLFVHALARALAADSGTPVALGVAVAIEAGLIVPVLRHSDTLTLGETARGIADLAARARARKLTPDETQGAQMTLTNVGSFGNLSAAPIVPLGQPAILGPGLVEPRPMPTADGGIRPAWRCRLTLMFDRRALTDLAADRLLLSIVHHLTQIPAAA